MEVLICPSCLFSVVCDVQECAEAVSGVAQHVLRLRSDPCRVLLVFHGLEIDANIVVAASDTSVQAMSTNLQKQTNINY